MIVKIKCYNKAKPYFLINSASTLEYGLHRANVATRECSPYYRYAPTSCRKIHSTPPKKNHPTSPTTCEVIFCISEFD